MNRYLKNSGSSHQSKTETSRKILQSNPHLPPLMYNIKMSELEPVIHLTKACNHKCLFCSRKGDPKEPDWEIKKILDNFKDTVTLEGGEPMLAKNLLKWTIYAKKKGVRETMLVTNGFSLEKESFVLKLLAAGIDIFNFNFPSHIESIYNLLSGSKDYVKTVSAIKNTINFAGKERVRLTFVFNSINASHLKDYAHFIKKEFGDIFYTEINMLKVLGNVRKRKYLLPNLEETSRHLTAGFKAFEKLNLNFITDGFPLCFMKGFEKHNIDTFALIKGRYCFLKEKSHFPPCENCDLKNLCPGLRKDYSKIHGFGCLKPIKNKRSAEKLKKYFSEKPFSGDFS